MPSVSVKLYSVFFKLLLGNKLQSLLHRTQDQDQVASRFGITCRPDESTAPANPAFDADGVATKDIHVDSLSSLSLYLYLPDSSLARRSNGHAPDDTPTAGTRKLLVILQFHRGAFVAGSNTSAANDFFCRRIGKLLDAIVVAVGYRLASESMYPVSFDDGVKVLNWLGKQANLA